MTSPLSAVVAGHLCLDIFPNFESLPSGKFETIFKPGRLLEVSAAQFSTGGPVSNTGLALHHLGVPVNLIAKIGADPFGQIVRDLINRRDPRLIEGIVVDPSATTSYSVIISPPALDRIFLHCTGANDTFIANDVSYDLSAQAALFHFGYPSLMRQMFLTFGKETADMMRRVKAAGTTTSMDMSFPDAASDSGRADWRTIFAATLPYVDIFLPSLEEMLFVLHNDIFEKLCAKGEVLDQITPGLLHDLSGELLAMGARIVVLKLGSKGLYLRTGTISALEGLGHARPNNWREWANREMWVPCYQVNVVGTTGSGDATIAGFLSALLRGMLPEQAMTMAVAVGACNVEASDALSGLKTWEDTLKRVELGWTRHSLALKEFGWRQTPINQLWLGVSDRQINTDVTQP